MNSNSACRNAVKTFSGLTGYDTAGVDYLQTPQPEWRHDSANNKYILIVCLFDNTGFVCAPYSASLSVGTYSVDIEFDQLGSHSASDFYRLDASDPPATSDGAFWLKLEFIDSSNQFNSIADIQATSWSLDYADAKGSTGSIGATEVAYLDPYAVAGHFSVDDGKATWELSEMVNTLYLSIQGSNDCRTWTELRRVPAAEAPRGQVPVDTGHRFYRLVEVDEFGRKADLKRARLGSTPPTQESFRQQAYSPEFLAEIKQEALDLMEKGDPPVAEKGVASSTVAIFCPATNSDWVNAGIWLERFYQWYTGYVLTDLVFYNTYTTASGQIALQEAIQEIIDNKYPGTKHFHLIGDANDWMEFADDGPDRASVWTGDWANQRLNLINNFNYYAAGQRELNILPSYRVNNPGVPGENMAMTHPYFFNDKQYGNMDSDPQIEAYIARWPVSTPSELSVMASKFAHYNDDFGNWGGTYKTLMYVGDKDYYIGSGDGTVAGWIANNVATTALSAASVNMVLESEMGPEKVYDYLAESCENWRQYSPDLALIISSASSRWSGGKFFDIYENWSTNFDLGGEKAVMLAATCESASFVTTETPSLDGTVCERFLMAPAGGAVAWMGPTCASWGHVNQYVANYVLEEMQNNPTRPMAESFTIGLNRLYTEYGSDPAFVQVLDSYVYLGDPVSPFRRRPYEMKDFFYVPKPGFCDRGTATWKTSGPVACRFTYSLNGVPQGTVETPVGTEHSVGLSNVQRYSRYSATITLLDHQETSSDVYWKTMYCIAEADPIFPTIDPNPFNPATRLSYSLAAPDRVLVEVYDIKGRLIRTLVDENQAAGPHSVTWRGNDDGGRRQAAGLYFLRFRTSQIDDVRKVTMVK